MKGVNFCCFLLTVFFGNASAQRDYTEVDYRTAIGVRAGLPFGISAKRFLNPTIAIEGILSSRYRGITATCLFQRHKSLTARPGLNLFYGPGLHIGSLRFYDGPKKEQFKDPGSVFGLDGIIGIEYFAGDLPITIGIDFKPSIELLHSGFVWWDTALTLRYSF